MKKTLAVINAVAGFALIIILVLVFSLDLHYSGSKFPDSADLGFSWSYSDGSPADLMELRTDCNAMTTRFSGKANRTRNLCFHSRNVTFRVMVDNEEIYDFHPALGSYYGYGYGAFLHCVPLPDGENDRTMTIEYSLLQRAGRGGFENMRLEDTYTYLGKTIQGGSVRFLMCVLTFFFGTFLFVFALIQHRTRSELTETLSLGVTSMMLSIWEFPPVGFLQMLSGNPAAERAMNNIILILMPLPIVSFVVSITGFKRKDIVYAYITACIIDLMVQLSLILTNTADFHELLFISHFIIIAGILLIVFMIARAVRRNRLSKEQRRFLIPSVIIVITTGIIDMARFYISESTDTSAVSRLGLLVFILILVYYEMKRLVDIQVLSSRAELMHKLATEDSLTGIKNRTGFNEYEQEIMKRRKGKCLFVHFDVNRLKKVNDTFGHAEGDRHIIAAANVISESFGEYGECFRVGGDEFFVILDAKNCDDIYPKCIEKCIAMQKNYNETEKPPVELQLAYGMAEYIYSDGSPEKAEQLADSRMYEKKRQMKVEDRKRATEAMLSRIHKKEDVREHASALYARMLKKSAEDKEAVQEQ